MTPIFDTFAAGFGGALAERAANAVVDGIQRLWNSEGMARKKQYEEIVKPAFEQFEQIYEEYEKAFASYRDELVEVESTEQILALAGRIEGDLRFTAKARVDLLAHLKKAEGTPFEGFVRAIVDFLVSNEPSARGSIEDSLAPPEIVVQRYRRALIADLKSVLDPWAAVLDPGASAPPLQGAELEHALEELCDRHGIAKDDPNRDGRLRVKMAIEHLDSGMNRMVSAYKRVREEYDALSAKLLD
jgi:hypothetical protein